MSKTEKDTDNNSEPSRPETWKIVLYLHFVGLQLALLVAIIFYTAKAFRIVW